MEKGGLSVSVRKKGLASAALVLLVTSCLPSDPVPPPVAVTLDHGVLTLIAPVCPDDTVVSVTVSADSDDSPGRIEWHGEDPVKTEDPSRLVLDSEHWRSVHGSYAGLDRVAIAIDGTIGLYGTIVDLSHELNDLADGEYFADGAIMREPEFRRLIARDFACGDRP